MLDTSPVADKLVVVPIPNLPGASILIDKDAQPTDLLKRIGDQIDKLGDGRVFTPDPLRHFCRANINSDPEIATEVMNTFNTFATQHNLLVLMSHHLRKAGLLATTALEAREAIQGVGGIVDHARAAMAFWLPKKERAVDILRQLAMSDPNEPAYRVLFAALVKANHPRPNFATRTLVRTDSDRLLDFTGKLEGEHVEELSAEQYDGRRSDLLDSIRKRSETGRRFKNSTHLPDGILHKENVDKLKSPDGKCIGNRKDIGDLLDSLVLRGRIKFVTHGGGAQWIVPTE